MAENTAHPLCQGCTCAWLILTTHPHPGGEPNFRPAVGTGKSATAPHAHAALREAARMDACADGAWPRLLPPEKFPR